MIKRLIPLTLFIGSIIFSGCSTGAGDKVDHPDILPRSLTAHEKKLIKADEVFSYDIFRRISAEDRDNNVFISPLSISMALGMTLNGADGATRDSMKQVLRMDGMNIQQINESFQSLIKLLVELDPKVETDIANSLWSRKGFVMKTDFVQSCKEYFNALAEALDFSDPKSTDIMNHWVSDNTNGRIQKIVDGKISPGVVLYLINALYFKGDWLHKFDENKTKKDNFYTADGSTVKADMMVQEGSRLNVYMNNKVKMVDLPYGDSLFTMSLMMPADDNLPIDEFIMNDVTDSNMATWIDLLHPARLTLYLPKFELNYEIMLNELLKDMGMGVAFSPDKADFSRINADQQLFISKIKHKTFLKVDEEGSEAAAATSVQISLTSAGPGPIRFNRPFVLIIRERISGTILFMGVMRNPVS